MNNNVPSFVLGGLALVATGVSIYDHFKGNLNPNAGFVFAGICVVLVIGIAVVSKLKAK